MKKVYKFTLLSLLSLLILLTTFLVGCSNKPTAENTPSTPTYPQTFETDTSRNVAQELVKFLRGNDQTTDYKEYYFSPNIYDSEGQTIATYIQVCHFLNNNMLEVRADFSIFENYPTTSESECFFRLFIPVLSDYNSHNFSLVARRRPELMEVAITLPNTPKYFRENIHDSYAIRTIDFDSSDFIGETYLTEIAQKLGKCVSATLQAFDSFFRNELKYFPDKLEDGTVLPTEVSQYALLSYFHLPVAVKINPQVKS